MNGSETTRPVRARTGQEPDVIVFGQIARDLVLVVDEAPGPGQSASVRERREMLGGKGANQAVALAQLRMRPALAGVVGEDQAGEDLLAQEDIPAGTLLTEDDAEACQPLYRPGRRHHRGR